MTPTLLLHSCNFGDRITSQSEQDSDVRELGHMEAATDMSFAAVTPLQEVERREPASITWIRIGLGVED
jgi:hypothetical protein